MLGRCFPGPEQVLFRETVGQKRLLGRVDEMSGMSLKATCQVHPRCQCWVSKTQNRRVSVMEALCGWLKSSHETTADEHKTQSDGVKMSFGMRVRRS